MPNGLVVSESLFSLKPGKVSTVKFQIQNITKHDIVLPKRTVLGRIQLVQSVTPLDVKLKDNTAKSEPILSESAKGDIDVNEDIPSHVKQIKLDGLTESQKRSTLKLLCKEQNSFSRNDDDIGIVPDLQLNSNLTDNIPMQKITSQCLDHCTLK